MIDYQYDRSKNTYRVDIDHCTFLKKEELPLKVEFREMVTNNLTWEIDLMPGSWAVWTPGSCPCNTIVKTSQDKEIFFHRFDVELEGNFIEKTLYSFLANLEHRPRGLVIGSHDGRFGHWVYPVLENLTDVTVVDGSEPQFKEVVKNYSHLESVKFINCIVTPEGGDVEWFQGGSGETDSVKKEVLQFASDVISTSRNSIGINVCIQLAGELDWLQLDVEGLDFELITAMEARPRLVIFETTHMNEFQIDSMIEWVGVNGYRMFTDYKDGDRRLGNNAILIKEL